MDVRAGVIATTANLRIASYPAQMGKIAGKKFNEHIKTQLYQIPAYQLRRMQGTP